MNFFIRVDASTLIGTGHVMRCLTLADGLKNAGHHVSFICRAYPGNLIHFIEKKGFDVHVLTFEDQEAYVQQPLSDDYNKWLWVNAHQDAIETIASIKTDSIDFLIVDHYALDSLWEKELRPYVKKIMVIDDLANRQHDCDVLLDQNFYLDLNHRYDHLVPQICTKLLGPQYALIRPEFLAVREQRRACGKFGQHAIKNIMVFMGGADSRNFTQQVLDALLVMPSIGQYKIDVLVGIINPFRDQLKVLCEAYDFLHYHYSPSYYLDLLVDADIAIAAVGVSMLERSAIGLPSIVLPVADNQLRSCQDLACANQIILCQNAPSVKETLKNMERCYECLTLTNLELVDCNGLSRLVKTIRGEL